MIGSLRLGLLLSAFLLGMASSCGTGARKWGEIVIAPGAPVLLGVGIDSNGAIGSSDDLTPKLATTIAGHPLQIVGIPVHCQGTQPSDLVPLSADIQSLSGFVAPACSASCIYSEGVLFELRTTMLVPGCTAAGVVGQGFSNVFRIAWNDNDQARVAADYVLTDLGKAAVVRDSSVYSRSLSNAFVTELKAHGGSGQEVEISLEGTVDIEQAQRRVRAARAGAVFFAVSRPDAAELAARLRAALPETLFLRRAAVMPQKGDSRTGTAPHSLRRQACLSLLGWRVKTVSGVPSSTLGRPRQRCSPINCPTRSTYSGQR
jgi:Periplasmic binding protein